MQNVDAYLISHIIIFAIAIITPIIMFVTITQLGKGSRFRKIVLTLAISFLFGGMRWSGGSISHMQIPFFINSIWFIPVWTLSGILAAGFGLYAAFLLYQYSKIVGFEKIKLPQNSRRNK